MPSVNARKFGSKPNATVRPLADRLVDHRRRAAQRLRAVREARDEEVVAVGAAGNRTGAAAPLACIT